MTTAAERGQDLVIDTTTLRKDTNADTYTLRVTGSYPANRAEVWQRRLHPARLLDLLEQDAATEKHPR